MIRRLYQTICQMILGVLLLCASVQALAWGELGHRVTAEIAYRHLSASAKAQCDQILGDEEFSDVSLWPDKVKRVPAWHHTSRYHFSNIPDNVDYLQNLAALPSDQQKTGDVMMGILKAESTLRNSRADAQTKMWALKFLIHFIGDLHQPLHSGRPDDLGGNDLPVTWFGKATNLHALWDTLIIDKAHSDQLPGKTPDEQGAWYVNYLERQYPQIARENSEPDLQAWLNSAMTVRNDAYVGYDGDNSEYLNKSLAPLETQLIRGGYHLAALLNNVFSGASAPPAKETKFRADIDRIVKRPFESFILLVPDDKASAFVLKN